MKANELRIGNYVSMKPHYPVRQCDILDIRDIHEGRLFVEAEPIPLTPEWLKRFGFEFFQGWWYLDAYSPGHPSQRFDLYWSPEDGFMTKSRYQPDIQDQFYMRHIKYIHQVQNLFFSLTGTELTIVNHREMIIPQQPG